MTRLCFYIFVSYSLTWCWTNNPAILLYPVGYQLHICSVKLNSIIFLLFVAYLQYMITGAHVHICICIQVWCKNSQCIFNWCCNNEHAGIKQSCWKHKLIKFRTLLQNVDNLRLEPPLEVNIGKIIYVS